MKSMFAIVMVVGYIAMALAFVCGLGYGFYLLGVVELTFGKAAWGGFLLWGKMFVGGLIALAVGAFGTTVN
jgi:hypothetical protein